MHTFRAARNFAWVVSRLRLVPVLLLASSALPAQIACVNCGDLAAFRSAAASTSLAISGVAIRDLNPRQTVPPSRLVVLQSSDTTLTLDQQQSLEQFVRQGGSLLLALDQRSGPAAFSLSFLLPTTAWRVNAALAGGTGPDGAIRVAEWDPELFAAAQPRGLQLPFHVRIRPFDAVERGEGRYERYARTIPYLKINEPAGLSFWTRPLLNRDWRVRLRGEGAEQIPLLITGRYGAGRVAIFASSLAATETWSGAPAFWTAVMNWLLAATPPPSAALSGIDARAKIDPPTVQVDVSAHALRVTLVNRGPAPFHGAVLARARTWEQALVCDVERNVTVASGASTQVLLPLPRPSATSYQALDARDAYSVRLGVLSASGDALLAETTALADFRPPLELTLRTGDQRRMSTPSPLAASLFFPSRMGMSIANYAYLPGDPVTARVSIRNGLRNLAPLAQARDESKPDNPSVAALNDEAAIAEKGPSDGVQAYGAWTGQAGQENILEFRFPAPVTLAAVTLMGSAENHRQALRHNPGAAVILLDGHRVAAADHLDAAFVSALGQVRIAFPPQLATVVRIQLPWVDTPVEAGARLAPWLAEVLIDGVLPAPLVSGVVQLQLLDTLTGQIAPVGHQEVSVDAGAEMQLQFTVRPVADARPHHYLLQAEFAGHESHAPFFVVDSPQPLIPYEQLRPATAPQMGFIVTRGFRNVFDTGTGTREDLGGWGQPDDLIWAYSRQLKQLGNNARTAAARLYLSESDMRHYSTPWRSFPNGEYFYDLGAPAIVARMKRDPKWKASDLAMLGHSDRWDTAPDTDQLHGWQDFIDFDDYLRAEHRPPLAGKTRQQISAEIHQSYEHLWQYWHMNRYLRALSVLRLAFAAEGKKLLITAQGSPLVPIPVQPQILAVLSGQSDDSTWGMIQGSIPATTGRQMGILAFDPAWRMSTLLLWNFDSGTLNNPHWHAPAGTTEPTRRHIYDRAFRGVIRPDGAYRSVYTYGFNSNAPTPFTMTGNDWQQWWRLAERHRLIAPDGPLGAGIVISTARFADPAHAAFSGSGGWGKSDADVEVRAVSGVVRALQDAGVGIPFVANASQLDHWHGGAPLILLDVNQFTDPEIAVLSALTARGVRIAAFQGEGPLSPAAATLFQNPNTLLIPGAAASLTSLAAIDLAPQLRDRLALPLEFPAGVGGYGFTSQGLRYIVVEDWREQGRTVSVRVRATAPSAHAVDINDNRPLTLHRDGDWWVVDTPLRPGDASLICIQERP